MQYLPSKNKLFLNFKKCKNWEEKYRYIIDLGNKLNLIPIHLQKYKKIIPGCQSKTWLLINVNKDNITQLYGDSNSSIVKGIMTITFILYKGLTPSEILQLNISASLKILNLEKNLTFSRAQGLGAIVYAIRKQTKELIL